MAATLPIAGFAPRARRPRPSRAGVALLIVLMVTAILTVVILEFAESTRINLYIASNISDGMRAYYMAKSGVQVAAGSLLKDAQDNDEDHPHEEWANPMLGYIPISETEVISVTIADESGKFNLNKLVTLGGNPDTVRIDIFKKLLEGMGLDVNIADAVVDWIDKNTEQNAGGGEEDAFYGYASAVPEPYKAKNAPLSSIGEIKLIKGVTGEVYQRLIEVCTIYSDNKMNINTIDDRVLNALIQSVAPEANAQEAIEKINAFRNTEEQYFSKKGFRQELAQLELDPLLIGRIRRHLTFASRYFSVDVTANVGSTIKSVRGVVRRTKKESKLVYFRPGERLRPLTAPPGTVPDGAGGLGGVAGMGALLGG
ncbi:type II secretion system minor pseudopilin GspK [bacterium]|nr:type II secretion system minor pseudopilin GspK [bacterium]